jgi:hypothetical protein
LYLYLYLYLFLYSYLYYLYFIFEFLGRIINIASESEKEIILNDLKNIKSKINT